MHSVDVLSPPISLHDLLVKVWGHILKYTRFNDCDVFHVGSTRVQNFTEDQPETKALAQFKKSRFFLVPFSVFFSIENRRRMNHELNVSSDSLVNPGMVEIGCIWEQSGC